MARRLFAPFAVLATTFWAHACASTSSVVGETIDAGPPPTLSSPAEESDASSTPNQTTSFCPTNTCAAPFTTCPSSNFPCDIDLSKDPYNCGRCGVVCPGLGDLALGAQFVCIDGKCEMQCLSSTFDVRADCDGVRDNGCETTLRTVDNCGTCGDRCASTDRCNNGKCGCTAPLVDCQDLVLTCVDLATNDNHCGACNNRCANAPATPPPHALYGCVDSTCAELKCDINPPTVLWTDCNGDLTAPGSDGCEIDLAQPDDENCGACGLACPGGSHCNFYYDSRTQGNVPACACPPGTRECAPQVCIDIKSGDPTNCGACGRACPGMGSRHADAACVNGECKLLCADGWGDCNDNAVDGCETNLLSDPQNCGGCGVSCNGVAGQACVGGKCAVKPCPGGVN
ncbi:hypothetical protein [Labilithrix luteola]|nr:hypothetical protein [Labilithrix luteola]